MLMLFTTAFSECELLYMPVISEDFRFDIYSIYGWYYTLEILDTLFSAPSIGRIMVFSAEVPGLFCYNSNYLIRVFWLKLLIENVLVSESTFFSDSGGFIILIPVGDYAYGIVYYYIY